MSLHVSATQTNSVCSPNIDAFRLIAGSISQKAYLRRWRRRYLAYRTVVRPPRAVARHRARRLKSCKPITTGDPEPSNTLQREGA
jgi:hypothetical protein